MKYNLNDILICKNDQCFIKLTIGKSYRITQVDEHGLQIITDDNIENWFNYEVKDNVTISHKKIEHYFYTKEELRLKKLESL